MTSVKRVRILCFVTASFLPFNVEACWAVGNRSLSRGTETEWLLWASQAQHWR